MCKQAGVAEQISQDIMLNNSSAIGEGGDCSTTLMCSSVVVVATCVSVVGILANGGVLVVIFHTKRLHKPILLGFAALALSDFLYLVFNAFLLHLHWFQQTISRNSAVTNVLSGLVLTCAFSSASHVTFLSVQQYFMIAHPLSSLSTQTNRTVFVVSLSLWICCTLPASVYIYAVRISEDPKLARLVNFATTIITTFLPILIILICHFLKLKALRESTINNRQSARQRMSKVVSVVIISYLVTTLPINIHDTIKLAEKIEMTTTYYVIYRISVILLHLNFTINPFIYFIFTPHCRRFLVKVKCLRCCKQQNEETYSIQTRSTLLSHDKCGGRSDVVTTSTEM